LQKRSKLNHWGMEGKQNSPHLGDLTGAPWKGKSGGAHTGKEIPVCLGGHASKREITSVKSL